MRSPEPTWIAAANDKTIEVTGICCKVFAALRKYFAKRENSFLLGQNAVHRASSSPAVGAKLLLPGPPVRRAQIGNSSRVLDDFGQLASAPWTSLRPDRQATDRRSDV